MPATRKNKRLLNEVGYHHPHSKTSKQSGTAARAHSSPSSKSSKLPNSATTSKNTPELDDAQHEQTRARRTRGDILTALTITVIAIPQSLAYAQLIGLPATAGLWALIIGSIVGGIAGHSRILSTGPTAVISLMTAATLASLPVTTPDKIAAAAAIAIIAGITQLVLGAIRAGKLVTILAYPVIVGFTAAAALIIMVNQAHVMIGSSIEASVHVVDSFAVFLAKLGHLSLATAGLGLASLLMLIGFKVFTPKLPGALITIVFMTLLSVWHGYGGPVVGDIVSVLPSMAIPRVHAANLGTLLLGGILVALVGYVEGISMIRSQTIRTREHLRENKEFLGQGLANIASGLFGGIPVAGSVTRSSLAAEQGRRSRSMNILVGGISLLATLIFAPFFSYLPRAVLAAVIIVSVARLLNIAILIQLFDEHPRDAVVAVITLFGAITFAPHLAYGIALGVIAALLVHVHRSASPSVEVFFCDDKKYLEEHHYHLRTFPSNKKVMAVTVNGELDFTNADEVAERVEENLDIHAKPKYVLFFARGINSIDASAQAMLHELHQRLGKRKIKLLFSGIKPEVVEEMKHSHLYEFIGKRNIFRKPNEALKAISDE